MKKLFTLFLLSTSFGFAQTPNYSVSCLSCNFEINCITPTVDIAVFNGTTAATFSVQGMPSIPTGTSAGISVAGTYTLSIQGGPLIPLSITQNTLAPVSSLSSTFQSLSPTQTPQMVTLTAVSPTINITQIVYEPTGGTVVASNPVWPYPPGGAGTYTHCILYLVNGCTSCKEFTISINNGVGIEKTGAMEMLSVFPNPAKDRIYIKNGAYEGIVKIEVINALGEAIKQEEVDLSKGSGNVAVDQLPPGVYILKLKAPGVPQTATTRFVVSR